MHRYIEGMEEDAVVSSSVETFIANTRSEKMSIGNMDLG